MSNQIEKDVIKLRIARMDYLALVDMCELYGISDLNDTNIKQKRSELQILLFAMIEGNKPNIKHINVVLPNNNKIKTYNGIINQKQQTERKQGEWKHCRTFGFPIHRIIETNSQMSLSYGQNHRTISDILTSDPDVDVDDINYKFIIIFKNGQTLLENLFGIISTLYIHNIYEHENILGLHNIVLFNNFKYNKYNDLTSKYELQQNYCMQMINVTDITGYQRLHQYLVHKEQTINERIIFNNNSMYVYKKKHIGKILKSQQKYVNVFSNNDEKHRDVEQNVQATIQYAN